MIQHCGPHLSLTVMIVIALFVGACFLTDIVGGKTGAVLQVILGIILTLAVLSFGSMFFYAIYINVLDYLFSNHETNIIIAIVLTIGCMAAAIFRAVVE